LVLIFGLTFGFIIFPLVLAWGVWRVEQEYDKLNKGDKDA
jgi:hypothetical protein